MMHEATVTFDPAATSPDVLVAVSDPVNATSRAAIDRIKAMGVDVVMLTGDNRRTAEAVAKQASYGYRFVTEALDSGKLRATREMNVIGRPYALFVAGNRNTLVSLWPVADEATSAFMVAFFSRLRAGESQAAALARTKRAFLRERQEQLVRGLQGREAARFRLALDDIAAGGGVREHDPRQLLEVRAEPEHRPDLAPGGVEQEDDESPRLELRVEG